MATRNDWATAVVSLLTGKERFDVGGERRSGLSLLHNQLLNGIAVAYQQRLERAFRQEGPILLLERMPRELPHLQGTLIVSRWLQKALWRPHIFPVNRVELAHDNPFTHGLVRVADALARVAASPEVKTSLRALSRDLSIGIPNEELNSLGVVSKILPPQWSAYKPAWSLAVAVLTKTSLFGHRGAYAGIGVAVESWPLLETLLERTLEEVSRVGQTRGLLLESRMKGKERLLTQVGSSPQENFSPEPDGRLFNEGRVVATFEAKYSVFNGRAPVREHIFQSLSTAAACGSPVAVLVYPGDFEPLNWRVSGFNGQPKHLLAIGLDMFTWLTPDQKDARAEALISALTSLGGHLSPSL